jgi:hypothetical protein
MVALNVLLWLGCAGIGLAILSRGAVAASAGDPGAPPRSSWSRVGLAACVGLAVLLALGSVTTLLAVPVLPFTWLFVGVGVALLAWRLVRDPRAPLGAGVVLWSVVVVGAFGFMLAVESVVGLSKVWPNPCDDLLAYIPMAQRLLDTGQVIEPWSLRRLQHLGGQPFLQAFPIGMAGYSAFGVTETLTASTFVAGLFAASGFRGTWSRLCCVGVILAVPMFVVPRGNSAAVLLTVPLLIAGFLAVAQLRAALSIGVAAAGHRWAIASGLLLAGCASLRTNVAPVAGLVLAVGVLTVSTASRRARVVSLCIGVGTALGATAGWALGSWQSSGSPAFPVVAGNVNLAVATSRDPALHGFFDNLARTADLLLVGRYGPYVAAVLMTVVLAWLMRRRLPDAGLVAIVGVAAFVNIALLATFLTLGSRIELARYTFPISAALVLFFLYETVRGTQTTAGTKTVGVRTRSANVRMGLVLVPALVLFGYVFAPNPMHYVRVYRAIAPGAGAAPGELAPNGHSTALEARIATDQQRSDYRQAAEILRGRGRTIAAVDRPYLIDYRVDDIPSLDLVGWAAPGGDFPLLGTTLSKIQLLRSEGYELLLATDPAAHSCINPTRLAIIKDTHPRPAPLLATYHFAWVTSLVEIIHLAPGAVQRVGSLLVIDLADAAAQLIQSSAADTRSRR